MMIKLLSFRHNTGFMKYFKNTSWLMAEKVVRMFVSFFVSVWLIRYLGPNQFGELNFVLSIVFLFSTLASFGIDGFVTKELVEKKYPSCEILGTTLGTRLFGSIIMIVCVAIWTFFNKKSADNANVFILIIALSYIFQSLNVLENYFTSKVNGRYIFFANICTLLVANACRIWGILTKQGLLFFSLNIALENVLYPSFLLIFYSSFSDESLKKWRFRFELAKSLVKKSYPVALSGIFVMLYMKIDQVMLKEMANTRAVGEYAAAARLSEIWYFIPATICASLYPAIVSAKQQSEEMYNNRLQALYELVIWIAIGFALFFSFFSEFTISLLYGEQYQEAANILKVHSWAGILVAFGIVKGQTIIINETQFFSLWCTLGGALTNIYLNYIWIPNYGAIGCAYATLISYSVSAIFIPYINPKDRHSVYFLFKSFTLKFAMKRIYGA